MEEKQLENQNLASLSEDSYSVDKNLDQAYKKNSNYLSGGIKTAIIYNFCLCFGLYYFTRNVSYFKTKYLKKKEITNFSIARKTILYTFVPLMLIFPNVLIILGLHPIKVFRERRKMEEDLLSRKEIEDSIFGLDSLYRKHVKSTFKEEAYENKIKN